MKSGDVTSDKIKIKTIKTSKGWHTTVGMMITAGVSLSLVRNPLHSLTHTHNRTEGSGK